MSVQEQTQPRTRLTDEERRTVDEQIHSVVKNARVEEPDLATAVLYLWAQLTPALQQVTSDDDIKQSIEQLNLRVRFSVGRCTISDKRSPMRAKTLPAENGSADKKRSSIKPPKSSGRSGPPAYRRIGGRKF